MKNRALILSVVAVVIAAGSFSCNNYSVSEKQTESFLKYFPISTQDIIGTGVIQTINGDYVILAQYENEGISGNDREIPVIFCDEFGRQGNNSPVFIGIDDPLGRNSIDKGNNIIPVEGGYIISGSSTFSEGKQGLILKIDLDGQLIWSRNYSGFPEMEFKDLIENLDGNFFSTGYVKDTSGDEKVDKLIIFETTPDGDSLWMTKPQGFNEFDDRGESILEYRGRIIVVGTSSPILNTGDDQLLLINSNLKGRVSIYKKIPGEQNLSGQKIIRNSSGELFVIGNDVNGLDDNDSRVFLANLVLTGGGNEDIAIVSSTYLDYQNSIYAFDFKPAEDRSMAICGWKYSQNDKDIFFGRVNENMDLIQSNTFGAKGYQSAFGLDITGESGFAITGTNELSSGGTCLLLKLDRDGELQ